jgi:hypothetical protein
MLQCRARGTVAVEVLGFGDVDLDITWTEAAG